MESNQEVLGIGLSPFLVIRIPKIFIGLPAHIQQQRKRQTISSPRSLRLEWLVRFTFCRNWATSEGVKFSTKGGNFMALENITVNGKPLKQFIEKEKSDEIQEFLRFEIRAMSRMGRHHIISARSQQV